MKSYLNRPSWSNTWVFSMEYSCNPKSSFCIQMVSQGSVHCMRLNMVLERCAKSEAEPPGPCQAANLVLV